MEFVITIVVALVAAVIAYIVGRSSGAGDAIERGRQEGRAEGRAEVERAVREAAAVVSRGRLPDRAAPGTVQAALSEALADGWSPREAEYRRALRDALGRVGAFLDTAVRKPLAGAGPTSDAGELRERIDRALGSLEDLEFFLQEPDTSTEGQNVSALVQQVTREFAQDQNVKIRMRMDGPVRAPVNGPAFMDALYLVLHNAGRFGGEGSTVDVTVTQEQPQAVVRVRDRGPGFTEQDFRRAFDPFYSTTDDGLGLGLPHARKVVEGMGGQIELHNAADGGGEVVMMFPTG